jgi:hypothetical protein
MVRTSNADDEEVIVILEIRTYRLCPGTTAEFVQVMRERCLPLLAAAGIRVVGCGASLVAEDGREDAYLIPAFGSVAQRDSQEEAFYGSDAWRQGPREAVLSRIETYHTVVIDTSAAAVEAMSGTGCLS